MRSRVTPLGAGGAALTKSNEREPAQLGFSTAAPHSRTFTVRTVSGTVPATLRVLSLPTSRPSYHRRVNDAVPAKQTSAHFPTGDSQEHRICALVDACCPLFGTRFRARSAFRCPRPRSRPAVRRHPADPALSFPFSVGGCHAPGRSGLGRLHYGEIRV